MKQIIWKKWRDPIKRAFFSDKDLNSTEPDCVEEQDAMDSFLLTDKKSKKKEKKFNTGPVLVGELGVIPIFEDSIPSKLYNFWIAHTNFPIMESDKKKIIDTLGIESLRIYSPYRFRIAIGLAFQAKDVRKYVEDTLVQQEEIKTNNPLSVIEQTLMKSHEYCAKIIFNNNTCDFICGDSEKDIEGKIGKYDVNTIKEVKHLWKK